MATPTGSQPPPPETQAAPPLPPPGLTAKPRETRVPVMPGLEIHYDGNSDWAALYVHGELDPDTVGDSYLATDRALELCGVEMVHDSAFLQGGDRRESVAKNLTEVKRFAEQRDRARREAEEKVIEAQRLLNEALAVDPNAVPGWMKRWADGDGEVD